MLFKIRFDELMRAMKFIFAKTIGILEYLDDACANAALFLA
jgi:hypothetical protein